MHIPDEVLTILSKLEKNGHSAYIVGGCVRDMLLGLTPKDFDICTSAYPEQVLDLFPVSIPTGIKHGTVTVIINSLPFEVTTFRIESVYTDHRHPDKVIFSDSLTEDLKRRDFTINAMAYHPDKGIIDPFNGIRDLNDKIIRTVGNPEERFGEDALRMLRAIRFQATFNFAVDNDTFSAIKKLSRNISAVSRERILEELNKTLLAPHPEAFGNLISTDLLNYIFPVPFSGTADFTPVRKLPENLPTRWSGLFWLTGIHDVDKVRAICSSLKMSNKLKKDILSITTLLNTRLSKNLFLVKKTLSTAGTGIFARALDIMKTFNINQNDLLEIEKAVNQIISENHCLNLSDLAINGSDLISAGFKPGKQIGVILDALFTCVLQNPALNHSDILLRLAVYLRQRFGNV